MLSNLEALHAVATHGTVTRAAVALRLSQPAVSKRLAALADEVGEPVVERAGRGVRLTATGRALVQRTAPLLAELKAALGGERGEHRGRVSLGVSESVLASWGAAALARVAAALPGLELEIHAHRSPVALERVRAGEYLLALVAVGRGRHPDLASQPIADEPMVVVPSGLAPITQTGRLPVLTIEPTAATWRAIAARAEAAFEITATVESFSGLVQMARVGLGHALVPRGVALAMGVPEEHLMPTELTRPVALLGRHAVWSRPLVAALRAHLATAGVT